MVSRSEQGFRFVPMDGEGKPLSVDDFGNLAEDAQKKIEKTIEKLHGELQKVIHKISIWKRETEELKRRLKKETARMAVSHLVCTLKDKYHDHAKLSVYLESVEEDIAERVDDFLGGSEGQNPFFLAIGGPQSPPLD
ncbi:MAG TPA: hypothetical protein ENN66_12160 [Proteobacteria bacterium]|nr:hypothetical protein [Pseudomonadota bacterium]